MSESLPAPDPGRFPELSEDATWVRAVPAGALLARIYRSGGAHPTEWHAFRTYGPLDGRFDPHPEPVGEHDGVGVMYAVLERPGGAGEPGGSLDGPFAAALLEVFQEQRMIRRSAGAPVLAAFEAARPLRLLDLADSDWIAVAGGNAAIASGERARSRAWARAIAERYPELDGVVSASSLVPSARVVALWAPAASALPEHPLALIPLDRPELTALIDRVATRYAYTLL